MSSLLSRFARSALTNKRITPLLSCFPTDSHCRSSLSFPHFQEIMPRRSTRQPLHSSAVNLAQSASSPLAPDIKPGIKASDDELILPFEMAGAETAGSTTNLNNTGGAKRIAQKNVKVEQDEGGESELSELSASEAEEEPPPRKKARKSKKASKSVEDDGEDGVPKEKKKTPKKSRIAKDEPQLNEDGSEIPKKTRKKREYPKKIYEIADVERKTTTFRGRLGYACLNTVLRANKPDSIFCSRTCRIASIKEEGLELPKGLALMNVRDLKHLVQWNEDNKIRFMRISSDMFPFASHGEYGYSLEFADQELREVGDLAKQYGHRLTMHPGQFTQLGSPRKAVVDSSIRELEYQCDIMDRMGLGADGVMIIHMGGVYGDKETTIARFKENYETRCSDRIKARLVLENDEICYNVDDIMPVSQALNIPIIFDYHHDALNPSSSPPSELIPRIKEVWDKKGIKMKQHLSEPRPGAESLMEKRAHADRCKELPADCPDDVDLMIEAKDKEQAVFELYRIYGLEDVIHDNLRPADPNPSMHTKGRKSNLKKKRKETGETDSQGEPVLLSDIEKEGDGGIGDEGLSNGQLIVATEDPGMTVDGLDVNKMTEKKPKMAASKKRAKKVEEKVDSDGEQPVPKKRARPKKTAA